MKECRNRSRSLGEVFGRVNPGTFGALALLVVCTENLDPDVVVIEVVGLGQCVRTLTVLACDTLTVQANGDVSDDDGDDELVEAGSLIGRL